MLRIGVTQTYRDPFLAGLNDILLMGAGLSFAGALFVLWLVREHEIEKAPAELDGLPEPAAA